MATFAPGRSSNRRRPRCGWRSADSSRRCGATPAITCSRKLWRLFVARANLEPRSRELRLKTRWRRVFPRIATRSWRETVSERKFHADEPPRVSSSRARGRFGREAHILAPPRKSLSFRSSARARKASSCTCFDASAGGPQALWLSRSIEHCGAGRFAFLRGGFACAAGAVAVGAEPVWWARPASAPRPAPKTTRRRSASNRSRASRSCHLGPSQSRSWWRHSSCSSISCRI